jgi:hypothetical protein
MISSFASQIFALRMIFSENRFPPRIKVRGRLFRDHAAGPAGLFGRRLMPWSWSIFSVYSNTLRLGATPGMNGAGPVLSPSRRRTAGRKGRFGTILSSLDTFL